MTHREFNFDFTGDFDPAQIRDCIDRVDSNRLFDLEAELNAALDSAGDLRAGLRVILTDEEVFAALEARKPKIDSDEATLTLHQSAPVTPSVPVAQEINGMPQGRSVPPSVVEKWRVTKAQEQARQARAEQVRKDEEAAKARLEKRKDMPGVFKTCGGRELYFHFSKNGRPMVAVVDANGGVKQKYALLKTAGETNSSVPADVRAALKGVNTQSFFDEVSVKGKAAENPKPTQSKTTESPSSKTPDSTPVANVSEAASDAAA